MVSNPKQCSKADRVLDPEKRVSSHRRLSVAELGEVERNVPPLLNTCFMKNKSCNTNITLHWQM